MLALDEKRYARGYIPCGAQVRGSAQQVLWKAYSLNPLAVAVLAHGGGANAEGVEVANVRGTFDG